MRVLLRMFKVSRIDRIRNGHMRNLGLADIRDKMNEQRLR